MALTTNSPEARNYLKYVALLLLFLNGVSALVGGIPMIIHPDGSSSGLPLRYLEHSPFTDYLVPGIILVMMNGVLSLLVFLGLIFNARHHAWLVMGQGIVLSVWIIIQMIMLREINFLHVAFGSIGIGLILLGKYLRRFEFM